VVRLIKFSASKLIFLGVDTRQAQMETRIIDRDGRSRIGLVVRNADPLHPLESAASGQVVIFSVESDSPADLAGLKAGDTLVSVEGVAATNALFTKEMINQTGRHIALTVRPPSGTELLWVQKKRGVPLGFALRDDEHTCVVHEVSRTHAALFLDGQGLRVDDVLVAINNTLVRSKEQAVQLLRELHGLVELRVMRAFRVEHKTAKSLSWSSSIR
jgi:C-terminal processing protease CtpA/Prc